MILRSRLHTQAEPRCGLSFLDMDKSIGPVMRFILYILLFFLSTSRLASSLVISSTTLGGSSNLEYNSPRRDIIGQAFIATPNHNVPDPQSGSKNASSNTADISKLPQAKRRSMDKVCRSRL